MKTQHVFRKITWLSHCAAFAFAAFSTEAADSGIIKFQESSAPSSENANVLIGHWRKTTISYTGPIDEHLVLHSDGTVENWTVTAYERREPVTGHWSAEGKTLTLSFRWQRPIQPVHLLPGPTCFPKHSESPRDLGKDRVASYPLRYAAMKTARNAGHIAVKFEIGSSLP